MLRQISLGTLGLVVGGVLSVVGTAAYFGDNATLNLIGFFYGIPVLLGGFALKAAELKPVVYSKPSSPEVLALRNQQATSTQNQIRKDITRYRYGQKAHLDSSLNYLGLSPSDEERPIISGIREESIDGAYALVLEFDSPLIPFETWTGKQEKLDRFFGEGVRVKLLQPAEEQVELMLISSSQAQPAEAS